MREELIFYPRTEVFNSSGEVELRPVVGADRRARRATSRSMG